MKSFSKLISGFAESSCLAVLLLMTASSKNVNLWINLLILDDRRLHLDIIDRLLSRIFVVYHHPYKVQIVSLRLLSL